MLFIQLYNKSIVKHEWTSFLDDNDHHHHTHTHSISTWKGVINPLEKYDLLHFPSSSQTQKSTRKLIPVLLFPTNYFGSCKEMKNLLLSKWDLVENFLHFRVENGHHYHHDPIFLHENFHYFSLHTVVYVYSTPSHFTSLLSLVQIILDL